MNRRSSPTIQPEAPASASVGRMIVVFGLSSLILVGGILLASQRIRDRADSKRKQRYDQTDQAIWNLVAQIERIAKTNGLPVTEEELRTQLGDNFPLDGWRKTPHYHRFGTNRFTVTAMSPWPEVLVFQYDSLYATGTIKKYSF